MIIEPVLVERVFRESVCVRAALVLLVMNPPGSAAPGFEAGDCDMVLESDRKSSSDWIK